MYIVMFWCEKSVSKRAVALARKFASGPIRSGGCVMDYSLNFMFAIDDLPTAKGFLTAAYALEGVDDVTFKRRTVENGRRF